MRNIDPILAIDESTTCSYCSAGTFEEKYTEYISTGGHKYYFCSSNCMSDWFMYLMTGLEI